MAIEEEMEFVKENKVWELVDLPSGCRAIGNKWVLKIKKKWIGQLIDKRVISCKRLYSIKGY